MATIGPVSPAANNDDSEIYYTGSAWQWTSSDSGYLHFGKYSSLYYFCVIRFALDAAIASGSTINSATLELYNDSENGCIDSYWGVTDSDDSSQVTTSGEMPVMAGGSTNTYTYNIDGTGVHKTSWSSFGWNTIDITSLIQYLVDTYSGLAHISVWGTGAIGIDNNTRSAFKCYEAGSNIPKLTIDYTEPAPPFSVVPPAMKTYRSFRI